MAARPEPLRKIAVLVSVSVLTLACALAGVVLLLPVHLSGVTLAVLGVASVLILGAYGVILYSLISRFVTQTILSSLQEISATITAITQGAVSTRITAQSTVSEINSLVTAINALAQKASGDITELRRLETVRSEFIANVSHELRTPIFSVQGYLETLLDGALDDPEVSRQFIEKAYYNARRLNALLSDLIDISRIESGELRMSFRYFSATELLQDVVNTMELQGAQRGITLRLLLPPNKALRVYGDRERLVQVLTNLIDNAIKYNTDNGLVDISAEKSDGVVRIAVRDTGIGIPPEHKQRLFERFYRVDKNRSRDVGGTGLGLAIVKHILEAHSSTISVESEPGHGTVIAFTLKAD
ncbi:MAG: sensor histidine kinase [Chlorobi bacterium]|nr:MAG: HAMP domain-containing protein [Bacteroidota bacterium]KXK32429.1 MAG: OmpR family signal transduction histidine kinase [Chlorobi bacterium OLB6]MBE2265717.1 ATP-binding protein [Flavobacteriales bacterium]MBL1161895.1 sensor histidine kinase [Chlorobiota bacterium]MBW7852684.1 ATP-binding protein [Candidatus Kapabacteria bacterium]MCC6331056.1 ATP-binding protein [Ignavibacteria bacterium]